ncbi:hypothetical protein AX17_005071 [Amanita inopinata Kibby_2008]|nr:hypothetical protein AX17_005071 [Amanita inopinata Kibby_2008]
MAGDPVAEKSTFLRMYMSNHPDTLVAYAKYYGKVEVPISSAEMSSISTKNMTLLCTLKSGEKESTTITFDPPLAGYEAVKPRLLEMKAIAQEKLGMIKAPRITSFVFPLETAAWVTLPILPVLSYLVMFPETSSAQLVSNTLGASIVRAVFYITTVFHALESLYTWSLCKRHQAGFPVTAMYVASTFLCGFPVWKDLRKRIQTARIDSVMKVQ